MQWMSWKTSEDIENIAGVEILKKPHLSTVAIQVKNGQQSSSDNGFQKLLEIQHKQMRKLRI